ncbi:MAG: hypothetical protein ACRC16_10145 [Aeromonas salmonicida]
MPWSHVGHCGKITISFICLWPVHALRLFANGYGIFAGSTPQQAELRIDSSAAPWVRDMK